MPYITSKWGTLRFCICFLQSVCKMLRFRFNSSRNAFHAAYVIGKKDGLLALQKGLVPALWYQFVMNGARLGTYQIAEKQGWTRRKNGDGVDPLKSLTAGALSGVIGAVVGSPFYLVCNSK